MALRNPTGEQAYAKLRAMAIKTGRPVQFTITGTGPDGKQYTYHGTFVPRENPAELAERLQTMSLSDPLPVT
jgi:hypothetical protein